MCCALSSFEKKRSLLHMNKSESSKVSISIRLFENQCFNITSRVRTYRWIAKLCGNIYTMHFLNMYSMGCVCVTMCVYQSLAYPHYNMYNSSPVQARIIKFGPEKQNNLVKIPIVLGGDWPWPSKSNLTSNSKLTPCSSKDFQIWTTNAFYHC